MKRFKNKAALVLIGGLFVSAGLVLFLPSPASQAGLSWEFERDEQGRVRRMVDPAGRQTEFAYAEDAQGRLRRLTRMDADGEVVMEFDEDGNRSRRQDSLGSVRYKHDALARLTEVVPDSGPVLKYDHETDGGYTLSVGTSFKVRYELDYLGRLATIHTPAGPIEYTYYSASEKKVRKLPNGLTTEWQYEPGSRLKTITHRQPGNRVLISFRYTYGDNGFIREIKELSDGKERVIGFDYDKTGRVIRAIDSKLGTFTYSYDAMGNRVEAAIPGQSVNSRFDWASRLVEYAGRECAHDQLGNLLNVPSPHGPSEASYTMANLLQAIQTPSGRITYGYDGDGNLVSRQIVDLKTVFVPDPKSTSWRPLQASSSDGEVTSYIWDGNALIASVTNGNSQFFLHDHLNSVRLEMGPDGALPQTLDYTPFGVPRPKNNGASLRFGFAGLLFDGGAGVYLTRHRAYDPTLGRFLQRDPIKRVPMGSQKDLSAYAYCVGNPVNFIDRDGAEPEAAPTGLEGLYESNPVAEYFADKVAKTDNWLWAIPGTVALAYKPSLFVLSEVFPEVAALKYASALDAGLDGVKDVKEGNTGKALLDFGSSALPLAKLGDKFYMARNIDAWTSDGTLQAFNRAYSWSVKAEKANEIYESYDWGRKAGTTLNNDYDLGSKLSDRLVPSKAWGAPSVYSGPPTASSPVLDLLRAGAGTDSATLIMDESVPKARGSGGSGSPAPTTATAPTKLGGISLKGAGNLLKGLGPLKGLAIDANGRLILIAQQRGDVALPPLRLDDLVTVFRSVYERGEAPYVSIDPDPNDPRGPMAVLRLAKGTQDTYVGWILYQADRIMKCYHMGIDSYTERPIRTAIPGSEEIIDASYRYARKLDDSEDIRDRFEIVVASSERRHSKDGRLTLADVPLKLITELSRVRNGKMEAVPDGKAPKYADDYCAWFTHHYQDLAREVRQPAPPDSGMTGEIPVFAELQRIALMAALAENLRDQGVPMPAWMLDYVVRPFPVPAKTPMRVLESKRTIAGKVYGLKQYGGVTLSPPSKSVRTVADAPEANQLAESVGQATALAPLWKPVSFASGGREYVAVALPGQNTQALGAGQMEEIDLMLSLPRGHVVTLRRNFNSFYQPDDGLGRGWTLDLPQLHKQVLPQVEADGKKMLQFVYQLASPLGNIADFFRSYQDVPHFGKLLVPESGKDFVGLARYKGDDLMNCLVKNGQTWRFNEDGTLASLEKAPLKVEYVWNVRKRLTRIKARIGSKDAGDIALRYDRLDRLVEARSNNGQVVHYNYDVHGQLVAVAGDKDIVKYNYSAGRVVKVTHNGKVVREFAYDNQGQVVDTHDGSGTQWSCSTKTTMKGFTNSTSSSKGKEEVEYDVAMRPVRHRLADGTTITWQYVGGAEKLKIQAADKREWLVTRTQTGESSLHTPQGDILKTNKDHAGRTTAMWHNKHLVFRKEWRADGQVFAIYRPALTIQPQYRKDGVATGHVLMGKKNGTKSAGWMELTYNNDGNLLETRDDWSDHFEVRRDSAGRVSGWSSARGNVTITRNDTETREELRSSWGEKVTRSFTAKGGDLCSVEVENGGKKAALQFDQGAATSFTNFDGGEWRFEYGQGSRKNLPRQIQAPYGLVMNYKFNASARIEQVNCGDSMKLVFTYDDKGHLTQYKELPAR